MSQTFEQKLANLCTKSQNFTGKFTKTHKLVKKVKKNKDY